MKLWYLQKKVCATIGEFTKAFSGYYIVFMNYIAALPFAR